MFERFKGGEEPEEGSMWRHTGGILRVTIPGLWENDAQARHLSRQAS